MILGQILGEITIGDMILILGEHITQDLTSAEDMISEGILSLVRDNICGKLTKKGIFLVLLMC
jgi:hypothetical protein